MAGKTAQLQVTVSEIKEKVLPELDDEFAQAYEDAESLAALRQRLRRELEEAARQRGRGGPAARDRGAAGGRKPH
ncbi:MAG: hypothetical protein KatS3mg131_1949 [Candidatus Tectimicrobiota bacterium]|nr:MAG: hypothetical protein KatS3mg131_1949 [Candidatus Tectomicrobia bacterium]